MDDKEAYKLLKKYGKCKRLAKGKDKGLYVSVCQGCGKLIQSDAVDDAAHLQYVVSRSGYAYFFHERCLEKAMNNKIQWDTEAAK